MVQPFRRQKKTGQKAGLMRSAFWFPQRLSLLAIRVRTARMVPAEPASIVPASRPEIRVSAIARRSDTTPNLRKDSTKASRASTGLMMAAPGDGASGIAREGRCTTLLIFGDSQGEHGLRMDRLSQPSQRRLNTHRMLPHKASEAKRFRGTRWVVYLSSHKPARGAHPHGRKPRQRHFSGFSPSQMRLRAYSGPPSG
jgi:hypothetical protein